MNPLSLSSARLIERRSDEQDTFGLANEARTLLNQEGRFFRVVTTPDATPVVLWTMDIKLDTVLWLDATVLSFEAATGNAGRSVRIQSHKNFAGTGGDGTVQTTFDNYDAGGSVALTRTGTTVSLTVTGVAATVIDWHARVLALECPWSPT